MLMRQHFLGSHATSKWGLVPRKTKSQLEAWNFQPLSFLSEMEGLETELIKAWLWPRDETSIKHKKYRVQGASGVGEHVRGWEAGAPQLQEDRSSCFRTLADLILWISPSVSFIVSFIVKLSGRH